MLVLQLDNQDQLNQIWETPSLRRFLGKRLGPTAVAVREDQSAELLKALTEADYQVETT